MNKVDKQYNQIERTVYGLLTEANELGRHLGKKQNRDVVTFLGWKAAADDLAQAKIAQMEEARQQNLSGLRGVKKLATQFAYFVNPLPSADSAGVQADVRAEVVKKFNARSKPPAATIAKAQNEYVFAAVKKNIRTIKLK